MHVVILAAFIIATTLVQTGLIWPMPWLAGPAICAYLVVSGLLSGVASSLGISQLRQSDNLSPATLKRHGHITLLQRIWLVTGLAGAVAGGYGWWVLEELPLEHVPAGEQGMILAPLMLALTVTWLAEYPFFRLVRQRVAQLRDQSPNVWSLGQFIAYNFRHQVLFILVPVGLILILADLLAMGAYRWLGQTASADYTALIGSLVIAGTVFLIAPVLIVRIWRTRRLPDGPLRDELETLCRKMGLRYREILLWRSDGTIANAGVMGLIPQVRYVLLSDALLEEMSADEIRAVFAHEAGHIAQHHVFFSMLFAAAAALATVLLAGLVGWLLALDARTEELVALGLLLIAWGVGFGWVSRRFERQSDVIGAWAAGYSAEDLGDSPVVTPEGAAIFARALQQVARLNGVSPTQPNWRHGSIHKRVEHVLWLGTTGADRRDTDRFVGRIKRTLAGAVALGLAGVIAQAILL